MNLVIVLHLLFPDGVLIVSFIVSTTKGHVELGKVTRFLATKVLLGCETT